jgi:hypothetical protein
MPETYRSDHYARGVGGTDVTVPLLPLRCSPDFRRYWIARMRADLANAIVLGRVPWRTPWAA